jgi:hypothetical protein
MWAGSSVQRDNVSALYSGRFEYLVTELLVVVVKPLKQLPSNKVEMIIAAYSAVISTLLYGNSRVIVLGAK